MKRILSNIHAVVSILFAILFIALLFWDISDKSRLSISVCYCVFVSLGIVIRILVKRKKDS